MFRKLSAVLLIVGMLVVIGCATHTHKVGNGAQGTNMIEARQWYMLWGLSPLNNIDTSVMAGRTTDYEITTQISTVDCLISALTAGFLYSRTVMVQK